MSHTPSIPRPVRFAVYLVPLVASFTLLALVSVQKAGLALPVILSS